MKIRRKYIAGNDHVALMDRFVTQLRRIRRAADRLDDGWATRELRRLALWISDSK